MRQYDQGGTVVVTPKHCLDTACRIERSYRVICKAITQRYYDKEPNKPLLVEMQAGLKDIAQLQADLKKLGNGGCEVDSHGA